MSPLQNCYLSNWYKQSIPPKLSAFNPHISVLTVAASNAQVYTMYRLLVAEGPQAPSDQHSYVRCTSRRCRPQINRQPCNVFGGETTLYTLHLMKKVREKAGDVCVNL